MKNYVDVGNNLGIYRYVISAQTRKKPSFFPLSLNSRSSAWLQLMYQGFCSDMSFVSRKVFFAILLAYHMNNRVPESKRQFIKKFS